MALSRTKSEQDVVSLTPGATALDAARAMAERHVGAVVIVDKKKKKPVGIVTDRDIATRVVAAMLDPATTKVEAFMTKEVVTARDDSQDVAVLMGMKGVRRVPLVDAEGRLTGVVALDDLLAIHVHRLGSLAQVLAHQRTAGDGRPG